jgi:hypothetical protein
VISDVVPISRHAAERCGTLLRMPRQMWRMPLIALRESRHAPGRRAAGLGELRSGHARPIPWLQAFWAPRADGRPGGGPRFRPDRLPASARGDSALLRAGFTAKPF